MDDFDDDGTFPAVPARRIDFAITGLTLLEMLAYDLGEMCESFEKTFGRLKEIACQHANHLVEQKRTHTQMARELETIIGEVSDG